MVEMQTLWLPIFVSAVIVFGASSFIHMVLPWHKNDYPEVPDEAKLRDAMRPLALPPGDYLVPRPSSSEQMRSPAFAEKMREGPVLMLTVWPNGPMALGRSLTLWFIYSIVIGIFAAYVASRALPSGAHYLRVFQLTGVTAFIAYSAALWQMSIWYRRGWTITVKATVDGLFYALLTAGTFGWLWPR